MAKSTKNREIRNTDTLRKRREERKQQRKARYSSIYPTAGIGVSFTTDDGVDCSR